MMNAYRAALSMELLYVILGEEKGEAILWFLQILA